MVKYQKLNVGCGLQIKKGYVNLDIRDFEGVDVVHDLEKFPWPFPDSHFQEILANHVLEHLDDLLKVMKEIWRISKKGAIIKINVPYFSGLNAFSDPTHKKFFTYTTFDFFQKGKLNNYFDAKSNIDFKILNKKIIYSQNKFLKIFNFLPNLCPKIYERFFAFIFPSQILSIELEVIKKK